MIISAILTASFILDLFFGDPPNSFHPVAWIGQWIDMLWKKRLPGRFRLFIWGVLITSSGIFFLSVPLYFIGFLPVLLIILLSIPLLKLSFSLRNLFKAAGEIRELLETGELDKARTQTAWHLVSRDTTELTEPGIAAAVIESTSENITDSFTSPFFFYLLFGLAGAWAFRFVNTCDAMLGYRRDDYEWGGKFPARLDDILNFIPARITAFFIMIAGCKKKNLISAFRETLQSRNKTESPNAGWTMAAIAVILDLRLEKKGFYIINEKGREPESGDIDDCLRICKAATILIMIFLVAMGILIYGI
ncbi:MAG: cobalamin biosynthesis protein [Spirochaetales bacterium]|nr:cobalamin biosynthesis protein [Spirochaetales bacterium]